MAEPLLLTVDVEEWFCLHWAVGTRQARWPSVEALCRDYYGSDRPVGEVVAPTHRLLETFADRGLKITFFILGEIAGWYPDLVREIAEAGHEVACHGMHHRDMSLYTRDDFSRDLAQARKTLEDLIGRPVAGFRAPALVVADWLLDELLEQGFAYDSSVCTARKIRGQYGAPASTPVNPYRVARHSIYERGDAPLIEIPIPSFPVLRLPGAGSILTRVFGWTWSRITLDAALRKGAACYYMHPFEFHKAPKVQGLTLSEKLFLVRMGPYMERALDKLLRRYEGRIVGVGDYIAQTFNASEEVA